MNDDVIRSEQLLREFKGEDYVFGDHAIEQIGRFSNKVGGKIAIVSGSTGERLGIVDVVSDHVGKRGLNVIDVFRGVRPNAPREDVYRLAYQLSRSRCEGVIAIGGGSCLDACKASLVLVIHGGYIDDYFGTGKVSARSGGKSVPLITVQTASSSAAHLTKYSNITDMATHQKKLIVDESIVPRGAIFQYDVTTSMPPDFTKDGAMDGIAHCWEVWMGASGQKGYERVSDVAYLGMKLIVDSLPVALKDGENVEARQGLGLGTDLGGYSIMLGGTNGPHLGSFSLVDILTHGRACAILIPYYTVLFSKAIQAQLRKVSESYINAGFMDERERLMQGRSLGEAVAQAMIGFSKSIRFPVTLKEAGASDQHIDKMINAAKNPQLEMKLRNMPIPMSVKKGDVDRLMKLTLEAAYTGEIGLIPSA